MECRFPPESGDRPVRIQKNFLHQILSVVMIAAVSQRQGIHHPLMVGYQQTEGIHVTILGSGDKVGLRRRSHPRFDKYRYRKGLKSWQNSAVVKMFLG